MGGDPLALLGGEAVERVRRIGSRCENYVGTGCALGKDWPIHGENKELKMEWGFKVAHGRVRTMFVADLEVAGAAAEAVVRAAAALCEVDLMARWSGDVSRGEALGAATAADDALWRIEFRCDHTNARFDGIWRVSGTNALDEAGCGAVLVDAYTSEKCSQQSAGVRIAPPPPDVWRGGDSSRCLYRLTPTQRGCLLVGFRDLEIPEIMCRCLSMMPGFALRRFARGSLEGLVGSLQGFVAKSPELEARLHGKGVRAHFYRSLRRRLAKGT